MTTISKFKLFWAWQDEQEERWLHEMAKRGLHLQALGFPGIYKFEIGNPRDEYYRLDFITDRKDYQNYLQLFKDAGWEHLGEMGGWQYFRASSNGTTLPEIYTDKDSKAAKYQRLIALMIVFLPIFITITNRPVDTDSRFAEIYMAGKFIGSLFLLLYALAVFKLMRRIQHLKSN